MQSNDEWMTLKEAASRLRVHYITLWKWRKSGKIRAYKVGGVIRVKKSDVDELLLAGAVEDADPD